MDSLASVYGQVRLGTQKETVSAASDQETIESSSRGSAESEPVKKRKKSKGLRSRVQEFQRWMSGTSNVSRSSRASTISTTDSVTSGRKDWSSATLDSSIGTGWSSQLNSTQISSSTLRPVLESNTSPPTYIRSRQVLTPSSGDGAGDDESEMEVELSSDSLRHPITAQRLTVSVHAVHRSATPSELAELSDNQQAAKLTNSSTSRTNGLSTSSTNGLSTGNNGFYYQSSSVSQRRTSTPFDFPGMLATEKMEVQHAGRPFHERNVDDFMDAKNGSDDVVNGNVLTDAEGVKVRTVKLLATQNVGFESLPVQFVNKATKAGFVFNILVIGETGIGKSTLINSLFNYDFKLPPSDYQHDSVTLDKHAFQLEEGSVRLHLTIIETKGYGDQLNMADSCQGIVEYIDKQYEAYFQEESQVVRRLSDYKDTRIHVCLFLLAPTGSNVRALDLECMKLLSNKVNIIPVIARGDSLTKKELDTFKRRIMDEIRLHKISIYSFPEDDAQVADLNRKMNADVPFAVVGSSEVHEVAGHKARARVYPWGIVDIENEAHCDFTRFREALLRVNMDHLMQTTNLKHYEVYRDRRMTELGYGENEPQNFMETITRLRQTNEQKYRQKEEETRTSFVNKVREKEAELKERERELHSQFEHRKGEFNDRVQEIQTQQSMLQKEIEIFHRVKSELVNTQAGTIKGSKKK